MPISQMGKLRLKRSNKLPKFIGQMAHAYNFAHASRLLVCCSFPSFRLHQNFNTISVIDFRSSQSWMDNWMILEVRVRKIPLSRGVNGVEAGQN